MYDSIDFKLRSTDVSDIDFLSETPCYFDVSGEHYFNGETVITGKLDNFTITVNRGGVNIKDGSLCKYHLGDNFKTLGRSDAKKAIEQLSDTLHLPIDKAQVTRLDIAQNFIVKQPVQVYYNHFGELRNGKRSPVTANGEIETLYYYQRLGLLIFYNKLKEQQIKKQPIPELYQNRNVLRYEQRYKGRLSKSFNVERVTGSLLYDEVFYTKVINLWRDSYFNIKKINDVTLNFEAMKGKTDLYNMGVLALVQMQGGELNFIGQINEAQITGTLTKKQAFDMRQAVTAACKTKDGITAPNEAILELDKKVMEAVKYYR
jgi:hypothetical protein